MGVAIRNSRPHKLTPSPRLAGVGASEPETLCRTRRHNQRTTLPTTSCARLNPTMPPMVPPKRYPCYKGRRPTHDCNHGQRFDTIHAATVAHMTRTQGHKQACSTCNTPQTAAEQVADSHARGVYSAGIPPASRVMTGTELTPNGLGKDRYVAEHPPRRSERWDPPRMHRLVRPLLGPNCA